MSALTPNDSALLATLARNNVLTIGRARIKRLVALCWRCINSEKQAAAEAEAQTFLANALWLAASGKLTEDMINAQPRLLPEQKADCLALLQMRYDAEAWRKHCEFDLPGLPEAVELETQSVPC